MLLFRKLVNENQMSTPQNFKTNINQIMTCILISICQTQITFFSFIFFLIQKNTQLSCKYSILIIGHARWNKRSCGVACLVKDNPKRSYFIRVLDIDRKMIVFDQEIYNQFRYRTPRPYFHTFEAEDGQVSK